MVELNGLIAEQLAALMAGIFLVLLILIIVVIVQGAKLKGMRRRYQQMMAGSGVDNLESLLIDLKVQMDGIEDEQEKNRALMHTIQGRMKGLKGNIGVKRYNALGEHGGDLSFSLAILDEHRDGMVLTGIYNRDGSYVYAKAVKGGSSSHMLSPEENEAIALAQSTVRSDSSTP